MNCKVARVLQSADAPMIGAGFVGNPKVQQWGCGTNQRISMASQMSNVEGTTKRPLHRRSTCQGGVSAAWNLAASPVPIRGILPSIDWPTKPAAAEDAGRKNLLPRSGHLRVLEQSRFGASGSLGPLNNEHPVPKIMPSPTPLHAEKPTEYQVQSVKGRREESSFLAQPSPARYYVSAWLVTRLLNRYPCMLARHSVKLLAAP